MTSRDVQEIIANRLVPATTFGSKTKPSPSEVALSALWGFRPFMQDPSVMYRVLEVALRWQ